MLSSKRYQLSKVNAIGATPFDFKNGIKFTNSIPDIPPQAT